nr:hypothetical protein [Tanacetum cinerariifolium]
MSADETKTYIYDSSIGEYDYGKNHDMKPSRITMTDYIGPTGKCVAREQESSSCNLDDRSTYTFQSSRYSKTNGGYV